MSTVKSDNSDLTVNASGSTSDIKFQANGVEKASISSAGAFTSTTIDATVLTGALPAISGASLTNLPAGGDNTPSFRAYMTAGQSFANGVYVKLTLNATSWDTDSAFNTSTYRFTVPTGKAGKYHFDARWVSATVSSNPTYHIVPYKNGGALSGGHHSTGISGVSGRSSYSLIDVFTLNLSVGDYVEFYAVHDDSVSSAQENEYQTYLEGFRLAGV